MGDLWQLVVDAVHDPTSNDYSLVLPGFQDQVQFGAMLYAVLAVIGGPLLAALMGRNSSGRLWSLLILAAGLVPYLALRYPVVFGGILPWGLLFAFRRWGFWRLVVALAGLLLFVSILWGRIRFGGYDFGLAFFEALTTTGWLLLGGFLIYVFHRAVFGHHRLGYIGGAIRHEEYRAGRRTETRRFRSWRDRKLQRAGEQVKQGGNPPPRHARRRRGGRGSGGGMTTGTGYDPAVGEYEVRGYTPDAHPDPEVRQQFMEGGSGPINGWNYDQYSGLYLPHNPDPAPGRVQVGGGIRLPMSQRIWRRNP
jgi:hypothetical protein